jgi:hypothetical protein
LEEVEERKSPALGGRMNEQRSALDAGRVATTARIIHGAVTGGVVLALVVFLYLRTQMTPEVPVETARVLRFIGYVLLVIPVLGSGLVRGRIPARRRGVDLAEWWAANLPKAVAVWALTEGGGLAAMILGWLAGDTNLLALGAAVSLALLFVSRPSRLQRET